MIIAVNNNKGGVTKTTTVTNLAGVLAMKGYKVLIVDTDNQGNAAISFGINPDTLKGTLYDVLIGGFQPEYAIINVYNNIDLLPSNLDLISFDFDVIGNPDKYKEPYHIMKNALNDLQFKYDYILIDTPPSLSLMNGNVFTFADKVLIPTEPETYALRSVRAVVDTVNAFKEEFNPALEIAGILFTKVVHSATLHIHVRQETRKYALENNIEVLRTQIPRTVRYGDAVGSKKLPEVLANKNSDKAKAYNAIWDELNKIINYRKEEVK